MRIQGFGGSPLTSPRIVTLDIETAPLESSHWGLWDQNIGLEQISREWSIISFSAKWLGEKQVIYADTGGRGARKVRDDRGLLRKLWRILDSADVVVAQNGKAFDVKKINARLLMHGLAPYSPIRIVDTMLAAKKHFAFTSNRLEWLSKHLTTTKKSKHRAFPGFELWKECLRDNPKAWSEMRSYNIADTVATEQLYLKLRPWIEGHPNLATYNASPKVQCAKCSSPRMQRRGVAVSSAGTYARYQCLACGGWGRGRSTLLKPDKRKALLA